MAPETIQSLRQALLGLGFDAVRFARIDGEAPGSAALDAWLAAGMQADMNWLERNAGKRRDTQFVLPGARTMIALGVNYWRQAEDRSQKPEARGQKSEIEGLKSKIGNLTSEFGDQRLKIGSCPPSHEASKGAAIQQRSAVGCRDNEGGDGAPVWARYSLYEDYHDTMKPALVAAGKILEEKLGIGVGDYRYYVDTGPILERGWAAKAGMGFAGKNAMLISRDFGNWLFLAAILVRAEIDSDAPLGVNGGSRGAEEPFLADKLSLGGGNPGGASNLHAYCGRCTRCLDACPTKALIAPGVLDARRCISYLTIENKDGITVEFRPAIGSRIYGCDICADVCPWNRFARDSSSLLLKPRPEIAELGLRDLLKLTPERFAEVFKGTPIKRIKLAGLLRNACVVAGNSGDASLLADLAPLTRHESALVREHALWAVTRLEG
jgi:epoxyqueuosine reductase